MSKGFYFITVQIGDSAYDYPKDMPIPRIGEKVQINDSEFGRVMDIVYQLEADYKMISIYTELI